MDNVANLPEKPVIMEKSAIAKKALIPRLEAVNAVLKVNKA